jgi:hypothetical protein
MTDKPITVGDNPAQEEKKSIDIALDHLFHRRDQLLEKYNSAIISLSMDFNKHLSSELCREIDAISEEVKFIARMISLIRP